MIFSGLGLSPANAVDDGTYQCGTSGTFTVATNVVTTNTACTGAVVIPEGVMRIEMSAFASSGVTSVEIPASVTEISEGAFDASGNLKTVTFAPNSFLATIGGYTFRSTSVNNVTIPASVVEIGVLAFAGNYSLTNINFAAGSTPLTIGFKAFDSTGLQSFTLPARVNIIGDYAFNNSQNLKNFEFESGSNLVSIGQYSFQLVPVSSITLPDSLVAIGPNVFSNAYLDYIEFPATVTSIAANSFGNLYDVNLYFHGSAPTVDVNAFINSYGRVFASTSNDLLSFTTDINGGWNGLTPIGVFHSANFDSTGGSTVPNGIFGSGGGTIYEIGVAPKDPTKSGSLFAGWSATNGGARIAFPYSPGVAADITLYALWTTTFDATTGDGFVNCSTSGNFTVVDNVVTDSNSCLGTAAIPVSVTELFDKAFQDSNLTSVTFASGSKLKYIGDYAFDDSGLQSITIPAGVTALGYAAFRDTSNLETVTFASGSKLKQIGERAFNSSDLASISIPNTVTHIWHDAFSETENLASVTFGVDSKLTYIGEQAFYYAENLEAIDIPVGVVAIDNSAFQDASELASITFAPGGKLTYLGAEAFASTAITSIQIPAGVSFLRNSLFQSANDLVDIYFLGDAPSVTANQFSSLGSNPRAHVKSSADGFPAVNSRWHGLTVVIGVYDVNFNSNGGSAVASDSFVPGGAIISPATPKKSGYKLAGWSATNGGSLIRFPYSPAGTKSATLFAKWTKVTTQTSGSGETVATGGKSKSLTFTAGSSLLTTAQKASLKKLVKSAGANSKFIVTGTAGRSPGVSDAAVLRLAKSRALKIKAYLEKLGVKNSDITIKTTISKQGTAPKAQILERYLAL